MRIDLNALWVLCWALHFIITGSAMVFTQTLQMPHNHLHHHQPGRRTSRSSISKTYSISNSISSISGGSIIGNHWRQLEVNLSGSSSSPVEPIKPLLDLSSGNLDGSLTIPSHPVFDEAAPTNLSSLAGQSAYLHCLVHNLANKSVSWIRQRDLHILTVGRYTYTTDQRYQVIHSQDSQDWILKIKYAQVRDSGNYECQVSTKPIKSYVVHLNVYAAARAEIIGSPDMHVDIGSTINLTCIITHSAQSPDYIHWYHNKEIINYDSPRGGITLLTERGKSTTGYLLIQNAQPSDTGNYSCSPSNTKATTLRLHVLNGETPAAMQTNSAIFLLPFPLSYTFVLALIIWNLAPLRDIEGDFPSCRRNLRIPERCCYF